MGKNLIQQARGKGGPRYRAPSFRYAGEMKLPPTSAAAMTGKIVDIVDSPGHSAPLARIKFTNGADCLVAAHDGCRVGDTVAAGQDADSKPGNILPLKSIPEGTDVFNIESMPGDGGRFCRTSGGAARLLAKTDAYALVQLPSKKERQFGLDCRAVVGVIAGGGRLEKPFLKVGKKWFDRQARNKRYPSPSAAAQNAVDHPFGNKRTARKAKQVAAGHNAPPGRKVGKLWPRRTGRKK